MLQTLDRTVRRLLLALAAWALLCGVSAAQTGGAWFQMSRVVVKPEMVEEFQKIQEHDVTPYAKESGTAARSAWRTTFGSRQEFWFLSPMPSFASYNHPRPVDFGTRIAKTYYSREVRILRHFPELSTGARLETPKVAVVSITTVAPDKYEEFIEFTKRARLDVWNKAGVDVQVYQETFGGQVRWYTAVLFESFEEMGKGSPTSRVLEGEALHAHRVKAQSFGTTERLVLSAIPEFSFGGRLTR